MRAVAGSLHAMPQPQGGACARAAPAIGDAQEHGVTSVQDIAGSPSDLDVDDEARRAGDLTVRVYAGIPLPGDRCRRSVALDALSKRDEDDALLKAGMAVVTLDGAVESQTAAVLEPGTRVAAPLTG